MTRQMKKAVYEAPLTEHFQVELEGVFCGSVDLENNQSSPAEIEEHQINDSFKADFSTGNWD